MSGSFCSSVVIVFLLWSIILAVAIRIQWVFISLCPLQVKKSLILLLEVFVLGKIGPESSCISHALQVIATSLEWSQLWTPIVLLEQEVSVDSVPKQLTLSSQIGPVVDPNLQNVYLQQIWHLWSDYSITTANLTTFSKLGPPPLPP